VFDVFDSDEAADGLSASALKQQIYQTARTRKSTNASTFIDNQNIISLGFENTLYTEGKVAAIEALNDQKSQSEVETAALDAMEAHATTVEKNLLKSWNESVNEAASLYSAIEEHPDLSPSDELYGPNGEMSVFAGTLEGTPTKTVTLSDGTDFDVERISHGSDVEWGPTGLSTGDGAHWWVEIDGEDFTYLEYAPWNSLWSDLQSAITDVNDGLITWVGTAYEEVQSGDIEITDLQTPQTRANMMAEEGAQAQSIADLQALNVPIDVGREVTVELSSTSATLRGTLGLTSPDAVTLEAGTTYDPTSWDAGDAYLTYDVSTGQGSWSAYEEGVDGGTITLEEEPYEDTLYRFDTAANETAEVTAENFTAVNDSGGEVDPQNATHWEADVSSQLETAITEITEADFYARADESRYVTIQIQEEFTLEAITNLETNEEAESMEFQDTEPQTDDNYITQEEWTELEEQNEELIEKYEESQESAGDGFLGGILPGSIEGQVATAAGGVVVVGGVLGLIKKVADFYLPGR